MPPVLDTCATLALQLHDSRTNKGGVVEGGAVKERRCPPHACWKCLLTGQAGVLENIAMEAERDSDRTDTLDLETY